MIVALVSAALVIIYACASLYVRKAISYLKVSEQAWERMHAAAKKVISNQEMPEAAAVFATSAILFAGCGCLTRNYLLETFLRLFKQRKASQSEQSMDLTPDQRADLTAVIVNAIYYDSLLAPLSGFLLRRFVAPWLEGASEGRITTRRATVRNMFDASQHVIKHKKYERKLLLAHA